MEAVDGREGGDLLGAVKLKRLDQLVLVVRHVPKPVYTHAPERHSTPLAATSTDWLKLIALRALPLTASSTSTLLLSVSTSHPAPPHFLSSKAAPSPPISTHTLPSVPRGTTGLGPDLPR